MSDIPYNTKRIFKTIEFDEWFIGLPPKQQRVIESRLTRLKEGHYGDHKRFEGLLELRWINGIRIYCLEYQTAFIVVLAGGRKNGQAKDIKKAKNIKEEIINGIRSIF